jgi:hypothetical protein
MRIAFAALVLLGACASSRPQELPAPPLPERAGVDPIVAARAHSVTYRGVGDGFVLHIFRADRITLSWNAGANEEDFPKPEPTLPRWNGEIYDTRNEAHTLHIEIDRRPCVDANGENQATQLRITIDGQELSGCGRDL